MKKSIIIKSGVVLGSLLLTTAAFAVEAPTDNSTMGYDLYDIVVNDVLDGPIGFVGGLGAVVFSATQFASNWKPALMGIIGGSLAMNAAAITETLGALI